MRRGMPSPIGDPVPGHLNAERASLTMPSLFRFLAVVGILGGLVYGAIFALATFVQPSPREMTVTIPPEKLKPR